MTDAILRILLVEDEPAHAEAVLRSLRTADPNVEIRVVGTLGEYREAIAAYAPDIVLLDLVLPDGRAMDVLTSPPESGPCPILIMTSHGDQQIAVAAMRAGALDYIVKSPEAFAAIPRSVERALREWHLLQERRRADEALRESEIQLRGILESTGDGILAIDDRGRVINANRRFGELWRIPPELLARGDDRALLAFVFDQLIDPGAFMAKVQELYGSFKEDASMILFKDGRIFERFSSPIVQQGSLAGRIWSFRDITSRSRAEEALRKSEAQLSNALQMALAGHWEYDVGEDTFTFNDSFYRIFRTSAAEVGGYKMSSADYSRRFCHPDDAAVVGRETRAAIESTDPNYDRKIEHRFFYADGEIGIISVRFFIVKDANGRTVKTYGVNQDITERTRMEESVRQSEENFRRSLDDSPLGVRIVSEKGDTVYANKAILGFYGFDSLEEFCNTPLEKRYTPASFVRLQERMRQRRKGEFPSEYEIEIVRKDGTTRTLQVFRKEVLWSGQKQYQALYLDITERKRAEEALQETLRRLRQAITSTIRVLSRAVETRDPYTAGHQIRTTALAEAIAGELGLSPERIEILRMAGFVHDIGKISIPTEILSKPGKPTRLEYALLKTHAQKGYEILSFADFPAPLAEIVHQHHERMDGSGYPRGLRGDEIIMEARILAVADTIEAMASHRPYRPALGIEAALSEIEGNKGISYDPKVVEACSELFRNKGFRFRD